MSRCGASSTAFEKQVRAMARCDTRARLLMSVPGVGAIVSLTFAAVIGRILAGTGFGRSRLCHKALLPIRPAVLTIARRGRGIAERLRRARKKKERK
jgi:hypothetical protein